MIYATFHQGSGLGNQLHRYVMARVLAMDNGYLFSMVNPKNFKGSGFMKLDMGKPSGRIDHFFNEKKVVENGIDIRSYDPEINFIQENTIIDGEFQDERYFEHRLSEIRRMLWVERLDMPDDLCVINFRGGEYVGVRELFLPKDYWNLAIRKMLRVNPKMKFEVHTDDVKSAREMFPQFKCISDIGLNWRSIRYARYLILSNSSFAILPALLGNAQVIYAPRYWARYNMKVWALPQNYYKKFTYIDHETDR
jgi:hypothetical protein